MGACCGKVDKKKKHDEDYYEKKKIAMLQNQGYGENKQNKQNNYEELYDKSSQEQSIFKQEIIPMQGRGIKIGGQTDENQIENEEKRRQMMAEAAEKRFNQGQMRGVSTQAQIDYEFKLKKQQELEYYERNNQGQQYNLKWK